MMNFKKIFFNFLLINSIIPTIQANIIQAIEYNDLEGMQAAFNQNPASFFEPFLDTLETMSPIHKAAMTARDPRVLQLLLQAEANINQRSETGRTPLFYALKYNPNPDMALFLINQGADTNARDNSGEHVFLSAIYPEVHRSDIDKAKLETAMIRHGLDLSNLFPITRPETRNLPSNIPPQAQEQSIRPTQILNNEDICGVCLEPVTTLAENNIQIYKTACCKQFLCGNCIRDIQASGRRISCPFCRAEPLDLDTVEISTNGTTQQAVVAYTI